MRHLRPLLTFGGILLVLLAALIVGTAGGGASPVHVAAAEPTANLWVDTDGGSCARTGERTAYRTAAACRSLSDAWTRCRPGDLVLVKAGSYAAQTVAGNKAAPGCTIRGETGTTIGDLATDGAFLTLENVTVDVGDQRRAGWRATADSVTLRNVRIRGRFVSVDVSGARDVRWIRGELGIPGELGGRRVCGEDAEPVQLSDAERVTFDGIRFHPQDADPTPSACSANGFHLEMIRLDGGTRFFTLRNSVFVNGDRSGTASVFVTVPTPGSGDAPHDLKFENNVFGTNDAVGAFNIHSNVTRCVNFTFAYNTFFEFPGAFQCTEAVNVRWIGNLGVNAASSSCFGTFTNNVWQDTRRDACGSDRWVSGPRGETSRLGLGGDGGFRLQPGSPAINAGERGGYCAAELGGRDLGGQGRPKGMRCDAGADEFDRAGPGPVSASVTDVRWVLRTLRVRVRLEEPVVVDVAILRRGRTLTARRVSRMRQGTRTIGIPIRAGVPPGRANVRVVFEDGARDQKTVRRAIVVPR